MFITIEGVDGCGKTTQCQLLSSFLSNQNYDLVLTREPGGGGDFSMDIRKILSNSDSLKLSELLAIYAARNEHLKKLIIPSIEAGKIIICDRFLESSLVYFAYQDIENNSVVDKKKEIIESLNKIIDIKVPDLTIFIDVEIDNIKDRINSRKHKDKYDRMSEDDVFRIIKFYRKIQLDSNGRIFKVDGNRNIDEVFEDVKKIVIEKIKNQKGINKTLL